MKKLILMLIPVAILLACEPIVPGPGGGGISNPDNIVKGPKIRTVVKYNHLNIRMDSYNLDYNADGVLTNLNGTVSYPSMNKVRWKNRVTTKTGLVIDNIAYSYNSGHPWDQTTYKDSVRFFYNGTDLSHIKLIHLLNEQTDIFLNDAVYFNGSHVVGYWSGPQYNVTYHNHTENISLVNATIFNNLALYRSEFIVSQGAFDLPMSFFPISLTGKASVHLISKIENPLSGYVKNFTYLKDEEGRIFRMNVLNNNDEIIEYYIFGY